MIGSHQMSTKARDAYDAARKAGDAEQMRKIASEQHEIRKNPVKAAKNAANLSPEQKVDAAKELTKKVADDYAPIARKTGKETAKSVEVEVMPRMNLLQSFDEVDRLLSEADKLLGGSGGTTKKLPGGQVSGTYRVPRGGRGLKIVESFDYMGDQLQSLVEPTPRKSKPRRIQGQ